MKSNPDATAYFEAKRGAKVCIEEFYRLREEGFAQVQKFCERFPGADTKAVCVGRWFGEIQSIGFKIPPDPALWTKTNNIGQYRPSRKTPDGKALEAELDKIRIPGSVWVREKLIGADKFETEMPGVYLFQNINRAFIHGNFELYAGVKGLREVKASEFHLAHGANEA